ncbi:MAG: hypothetical protein IIX48_09600 [Lachnospiraceae bacterium]|nr:hypothetical protein [Lachnospiraceae bacterium]
MNAENIFGFVIYLLVVAFMAGIGISQLKSKSPVGFYSGEKPPREDELSDVKAWNKKHGLMWLFYSVIIMVSYGIGVMVGDTVWCVIPMCGGIIIPIPIMIWYHHKLMKTYLLRSKDINKKENK